MCARIITKGLLGIEDFNIGAGTFTRATSTGGTQTLHQVNGANLGSGFPINLSSPVALTGTINGINTVFTLPTTPGSIVLIFQNRLLQIPGVSYDYTISGSAVTFAVAPALGDDLYAIY